jgi:omptin
MRRLLFAGCMAVLAGAAHADDVMLQSPDGTVTFSGSLGLTSIKANEYVYQGKTKLSQLIWHSQYVNTVNGELEVELPWDWHMNLRGSLGFGGDGHLADYDWQQAGGPWSDRSLHPDTRLNHYYVVDAELGRDLVELDGTVIGLAIGFKYTDVQWSAWGGSYVYSSSGFRDSRGNFDPNQKGISYRQSWPVPYLGLDVSHHEGDWTFAGAVHTGLAINGYDIDDHWVRSLRFYDYFQNAPTISLSGSADYTVWNNASLYLSGTYDQVFRVRGDTKMVDTKNDNEHTFDDGAGGDYRSAMVSFGLKGKF